MNATITSKIFTVELNKGAEHVPRAARRIVVNSESLKAAKLSTGDLVVLSSAEIASFENFAVGIIWPSLDIGQDSISVSSSLLLTAGLAVGGRVRIFSLPLSEPGFPSLKNVKEAKSIRLHEVKLYDNSTRPQTPSTSQRDWLTLATRELFVDLRYITRNQIIELTYEGQPRRFRIGAILGKGTNDVDEGLSQGIHGLSIETPADPQLWKVDWDCVIAMYEDRGNSKGSSIGPNDQQANIELLAHQSSHNAYASVGGLDKQIEIVRDLLEIPLMRPELFRHFGLKPPRGILLHGPPGTGKTHLARAIGSATNASVLVINGPELSSAYHGETESKLRDVFKQAKEKSPCIVVLDEIDALVPRREDGAGGEVEKRVVATLLTILDGMVDEQEDNGRVVIIGTTNRPNAIDPALRRPGRFDREIEIGVPDAEARFSILNVLLANTPHNITKDELLALAGRMYGYVGADIAAVVREAGTLSIKKWLHSKAEPDTLSTSVHETLKLELVDLMVAMPSVRPSAMRSIFVETPPVYYSDIGGQSSVIQKLREVVEWPLLHPEAFRRLGVRPPKGLLLYGPPGCSKTILARACACESGVNFVAVKGPELLTKFLGESERAVREIFRKARATSPSIIFFDEIDALASARSSDNDRSTSYDGILTSLLNEMDGVQELTGVTVIGATNRPDVLDSALVRPGRFDRMLWVGPPDQAGREEILKIKMKTMTLGADVDIRIIAELTDGCSGAEISSLCQEAAIMTMKKDLNAQYVPQEAFVVAANTVRRQITPSVLEQFAKWCNYHNA